MLFWNAAGNKNKEVWVNEEWKEWRRNGEENGEEVKEERAKVVLREKEIGGGKGRGVRRQEKEESRGWIKATVKEAMRRQGLEAEERENEREKEKVKRREEKKRIREGDQVVVMKRERVRGEGEEEMLRGLKRKIEEAIGRREGVKELWILGGNERYVIVKGLLEN